MMANRKQNLFVNIRKTIAAGFMARLLMMLGLVLVIANQGCKNKKDQKADLVPKAQAVHVAFAQDRDLAERLDYVGTVFSAQEIKIRAQLAGSLAELPRQEGERARAGDILALIDAPDLRERKKRFSAEVQKARNESAYFCKQLRDNKKLYQAGAIAKTKLDASARACANSHDALDVAQAGKSEFGATRSKAIERAPFSGRVLQWLAKPSEHVFPGTPMVLFGGEELEVRVMVNEGDLPRGIAIGSAVDLEFRSIITLKSKGKTGLETNKIKAEVTRISPLAKGPGRGIEVGIALPKSINKQIKHGASVAVSFIVKIAQDVSSVPISAIRHSAGRAQIFLIKDNKAQAQDVTLGIREGDWVEISPNIADGSEVVNSNLESLRSGTLLYPVVETQVQKPAAPQAASAAHEKAGRTGSQP